MFSPILPERSSVVTQISCFIPTEISSTQTPSSRGNFSPKSVQRVSLHYRRASSNLLWAVRSVSFASVRSFNVAFQTGPSTTESIELYHRFPSADLHFQLIVVHRCYTGCSIQDAPNFRKLLESFWGIKFCTYIRHITNSFYSYENFNVSGYRRILYGIYSYKPTSRSLPHLENTTLS